MEIAIVARGNPLANARELAGLSIEQLASASDCGKNTIWRMENGIGTPNKGPVRLVVAALRHVAEDPDSLISDEARNILLDLKIDTLITDLTHWQEQHEGEGSSNA